MSPPFSAGKIVLEVLAGGLLIAAIAVIFLLAPTEQTMGLAQRILYVHVAVAWCGLACFLLMAGMGLAYLVCRNLAWDHWAAASADLAWLGTALALATGSLWARAAWNTWWTWDPRLTTTFILWAISSACLILRSGLEDPHRRARAGAVLAIVGATDLPLVVMATRWFRSMHLVSPELEPSMRGALLLSLSGFTAVFVMLLVRRRQQLLLERRLATLECQ